MSARERAIELDHTPTVTHKPGAGGVLAPSALCGASPTTALGGVLRMHEWDYDCAVCAEMAGER